MILDRLVNKLALRRRRPGFRSVHGGLWPDGVGALARIERELESGALTEEQARQLRFWIEKGYLILPGAVEADVCDGLRGEIDRCWSEVDSSFRVEVGGVYADLDPSLREKHYKLLDLHARSSTALAAAFAPGIRDFLRLIFERDILLFQSLSFEWGSGDPVHQDTAYVVVSSPLEFAASWVALEDIQPGTGELCYYPGSHALEEATFGGGAYRNWNRKRDGIDVRTRYLEGLHERSRAMGLELEVFLPKKGDVLLWNADLAHGSSAITDRSHTRSSFVSHYCPRDIRPYYFSRGRGAKVVGEYQPGCHYSSAYYRI